MSDKKMWAGLVGGGLLLAAGAGTLIYYKAEDIEVARGEVAKLQTSIDNARTTIEGTGVLEREVIVLREMSEVIHQILPDSEEVNNLIHTLHEYAGQANVRTTSYKRKPDHARGRKADFDKVAYTLTLEGDTFQFLDLLNRVETHSRFIAVPSFKLSAATRKQIEDDGVAQHKIQLDLETYKFEPKAHAQTVQIEGYARKRDLLAGEINRRRQKLTTLSSYTFRGARGRRDPWIDPRVPANVDNPSLLSVQEQMDLVEEMRVRMDGAREQWAEVENAVNVLAAMIARRDLEEALARIEEDLRRIEAESQITYVPAQKRLKNDVYDPLDELRREVTESQGLLGPSKEMLVEVADAMARHIDEGEYELALDTFETIQNSLDLVKGDPVRAKLADRVRQRAEDARTLRDFQQIEMEIGGVAIIEGMPPAIIINNRSLTIGDVVGSELEITDIRPNEIDFYFRGLILTRVF